MKTVSSALDHPPTAIGPHTSSAATTHAALLPLPSEVDADEDVAADAEVDVDVASDVWGLFDGQLTTSSLPGSKLCGAKIQIVAHLKIHFMEDDSSRTTQYTKCPTELVNCALKRD